MIKVLVIDDSAIARTQLRRMLESDPEINVIAIARNGEEGIKKAIELHPDVITMDINMPGLDGISALEIIAENNIAPVIIVSSLTQEGTDITLEALEKGAFDYIPKPENSVAFRASRVQKELIDKVKAANLKGTIKKITSHRKVTVNVKRKSSINSSVQKAVAIGISTGGPKTIMDVIPYLPPDLPATVFLVQHMPPAFTNGFAKRLDAISKITVVEADAGMQVENSKVFLGKGGYHLSLFKKSSGDVIIRTPKKPEHLFMPSVSVMMESVLKIYGANTIGVLMTGMGNDGADAMLKIKKAGGITIAESEETAVVFGMPKVAIELGGVDFIEPSYKIAERIIDAVYS